MTSVVFELIPLLGMPEGATNVSLEINTPCQLGRGPITKIKLPNLSRHQITAVARENYVEVEQVRSDMTRTFIVVLQLESFVVGVGAGWLESLRSQWRSVGSRAIRESC
jgi:hypothetical protein